MTNTRTDDYFFVLGGEDNEMSEIKSVLNKLGISFHQPQKSWGKIQVDINSLPDIAIKKKLVFVECAPLSYSTDFIEIDHHNHLSFRPSSLLQVLELLHQRPNLRQQIIASIDRDFLAKTISLWPHKKQQILQIWEQGYRKNFASDHEYQNFKNSCQELYATGQVISNKLVVIYEAPQSMTYLAALANLANKDCILVVGSRDSAKSQPCFYQGPVRKVTSLSKINFDRKYWGRRYLGCRSQPVRFVTAVLQYYRTGGSSSINN